MYQHCHVWVSEGRIISHNPVRAVCASSNQIEVIYSTLGLLNCAFTKLFQTRQAMVENTHFKPTETVTDVQSTHLAHTHPNSCFNEPLMFCDLTIYHDSPLMITRTHIAFF